MATIKNAARKESFLDSTIFALRERASSSSSSLHPCALTTHEHKRKNPQSQMHPCSRRVNSVWPAERDYNTKHEIVLHNTL